MLNDRPRRARRGRVVATTTTIFLAAAGLAGCSGTVSGQESVGLPTVGSLPDAPATLPPEPYEPPQPGGKLVVAVPADVNGWNPNINQWTDGGTLMGPTMLEPLVTVNADGEAEPVLAESWSSNVTYNEWTIKLRDGVRFHNGQPFDAAAAKRSMEAYFETGLSSVALKTLYDRVEVVDRRTILVRLKTEWAQYPSSLATAFMVAPEMLDREDKGTVFPIGTGPFKFVDWQINKALKVAKWNGYWRKNAKGAPLPHLNEIEFRPIVADDDRQRALLSGDVDMILTSAPATARSLEDGHTVLRDYTSERTMLLLNTDESPKNAPNPFTNVHARRALAHATDSADLARYIGEGVQVTTQMYRPASRWGLPPQETDYPAFDPEAAKREIELYKKDTGRTQLKFTLKTVAEPRLMSVLQRAQAQWKKVGIDSTIDAMEQVKFSILVPLGEYQAGYYRGFGFSNPDQNHWFLTSANIKVGEPPFQLSLNFTQYKSPTRDRNLKIQRESTEFTVRKAAINAIDKETNKQALHIWLFDTPWAIVAQQRVKGLDGFRTHPFANFDSKPWFGDVWLKTS
jgi:peptide/nickel transport system substrate-binding protein